jgi:hypothetical protein
MKSLLVLCLCALFIAGCTSAPKFDQKEVRQWGQPIDKEYPGEKSVIAHYKKGEHELFYLAARHTNIFGEDTLNLVEKLFAQFKFDVLLIESIPHSSGQSPKWFVEQAKKGRSAKFIKGGESALAVIFADEKNIPFFAGEPDHQDIYKGLKTKGYNDIDILGFYVARQIPQWVRENEPKKGLFNRKIPNFLTNYCRVFGVTKCPTQIEILSWYKSKMGYELTPDVSSEEVAPRHDGHLLTQKISSDVGFIRDHFTLGVIQSMLSKYKKVAVIYGASHFITLRKSFDKALGQPTFIEDLKD